MFKPYYAYSFLFGIYIGGYTNLFSKVIISGLVLYMVHPESLNIQKFEPAYNKIHELTLPYISKIYKFETIELIEDHPKISILLPPLKK